MSTVNVLPDAPGVYIFKDTKNKMLYVGKATSLVKRVRSYFSDTSSWKATQILRYANKIDYIITATEKEALILECNLIKTHRPRYNVLFRDDKAYPFIKITLDEEYPRMLVVRKIAKDKAVYFGPYTNTSAMRRTMRLIKEIFKLRSCKKQKLKPTPENKPCLNYHINRCTAPCAGKINKEEYQKIIKDVCMFLEGKMDTLIDELTQKMKEEANMLHFEQAARLRDQIRDIENVMMRQRVVVNKPVAMDVIAVVKDNSNTCGVVLLIRAGRMIAQEQLMLNVPHGETHREILTAFIKQYYYQAVYIPPEIVVGTRIDEQETITGLLCEKAGRKVRVITQAKGYKKELLELAIHNAEAIIRQQVSIPAELSEIKRLLNMKKLPVRIEAFDISNISGNIAVGSLVVFVNGKPAKSEYRRFKIKGEFDTQDDVHMLEEIIERRYRRVLDEGMPLPDIIIVDGGKAQLNTAFHVLSRLNLQNIQLISIAKPSEKDTTDRIFTLHSQHPLALDVHSKVLHLFQHIRDEAHRFAITYHRRLRTKAQLEG
jgi:excinuclease ABC subunit C